MMNANEFSPETLLTRDLPWIARGFVAMLQRLKIGSLTLIDPHGRTHLFGHQGALPHAQLHMRDWRAVGPILRQGDIGFAQAYRHGWVDCPDLLALFRLALRNEQQVAAVHGSRWALIFKRLAHWVLRDNSRRGSRKNILAHYDLGNAFYELWLDPSMSYSAAIFRDIGQGDLELAQWAKYDRLLDSIDAKPGQHVLEIGCGWGGFAQRAAERGLRVTGITLSDAQLEWAQQRMRSAGFQDRVNLSICDYRDVHGMFDHVVSIEMFEAVGLRHWPGFFAKIKEVLRPGGRVAIQTIDIDDGRFEAYVQGTDFIQQFIFPGGMLPSPSRFARLATEAGLQEHHRFSFGLDYAETLNRWAQRFEAELPQVRAQGFDEGFVRIWRMYLAYCEAGFRERRTDVKQWLFTHAPT